MRKTLIVATREYLAAVRTKTFVITLVIMPVLMGGSVAVQQLLRNVHDTEVKRFAVLDRTPGGRVFAAIRDAAAQPEKEGGPRLAVERATPEADTPEAFDALRDRLSGLVRKGDLLGFAEVGADVFNAPDTADAADDRYRVRYETNRAASQEIPNLLKEAVNKQVRLERGARLGLSAEQVRKVVQSVPVDLVGGEHSMMVAFLAPFGLMMLLFMNVMMTATPLMQGVVEEKMQRIAEVLLGSVRPFDLMLGKLLGMTAVSLTIAAVYLGGAWWLAHRYDYDQYVSAPLLAWFILYQALGALMYGSLFIAVGAACTDMKETQNLMWPAMILCMIPLFMLGKVIQEPNSGVVQAVSFFPFATPMLMVARMAVPPGAAAWEPAVGAVVVLATTLACVWAAGRIFRIGILLQGKGAHLGEMARWVVRG
jgi:ABC-2 type transport system permease protein